jgi:hypothetical protein
MFTLEEIRNYIIAQDSFGDVLYKLSEENIRKANLPKTCKTCSNPGLELHQCPYQEDIKNDSDTLCNCCSDCQRECSNDI